MTQETPRNLYEKGFLTKNQFDQIDLVLSGKILSVFYELRSVLYLGVFMFTGGVGILVYKNIGELGHIAIIILLVILTGFCFGYIVRKGGPYSNEAVKGPTPYFDYITLLGSLLFISVLGYLQFRFRILDDNLGLTTLVTAGFFFFIAYRFDHLGVLALAITALASFWSISISPQKWYSGNFFSSSSHLHVTAIVFGAVVSAVAMILDHQSIKKHFTFTYINFSSLIFFVGAITGLIIGDWWGVFLLLIYSGCGFTFYVARKRKSFLLLIYAFLSGYIATTYLLAEVFSEAYELWFLYSILSCGGFVFFIIRFKSYFSRQK